MSGPPVEHVCKVCGTKSFKQVWCGKCGGGMHNLLEGPLPVFFEEDPKDVRIRQLEQRVRELERRLSDASWEASARHAQATGGWQ